MSEVKYFTQHELKRLFNVIKKSQEKHNLRNLCILRVAYRCALRASEIGLIKFENYNRVKGEVYCKRLKGSYNNTILLDPETKKVLDKYIKEYKIKDEEEILFKSQEKKPISRKMLDCLMKQYCNMANIRDKEKWHFHTLKHSIAVHLAESGLDVKEVSHWLSHKSINSTLIYFQFTTTQQQAMLKKLEKFSMLV